MIFNDFTADWRERKCRCAPTARARRSARRFSRRDRL